MNKLQRKDIGWQFYLKSDEAWLAMKKACLKAQHTIDMEQYILQNDEVGREFIEILKKKSVDGVKVRLLCDMSGSISFYNSFLPKELRESGVEVRFFNIIKLWRVYNFSSWFFRDHRKILVVDGSVGFIGGVGIRNDMKDWRDTHIRVEGNIVKEMELIFNEMWETSAQKGLVKRIRKAKDFVKGFYILTNSPHFRRRFIYHELLDFIRSARKYVYLTTPYFVPDRKFSRVLRIAAKKGVDVSILIPKGSNYFWVDRASEASFDSLLKSGVKIFRYTGELLHSKTAVIDDAWGTVGSFNLDSMSFVFNYEANIASTNEEFVQTLKNTFLNDLEKTEEISLAKWRERSSVVKTQEYLAKIIRGFM
ncbi:MAG: hypothetical protein CO184_01840 [Candidatus Zambryskibacteria bacterium CG_4_9_14_3_um_filter_40_16]|uniref:PLD phosphodiesterase domain-containing protein n=2 Tax=Candidatus Zambryskiibacteriota TaxID=1817925 RepID=A0A2M7WU21_9BACT|nr:MAG: hypothetical protein CO184_01840 [Candidatus Zambryskibacteria bacterium CG_4_9_14_3_um_filter_40_16]